MASSLLFKISTIFSGAGFRAAGEGLGRLLRFTTPLIFALAKLGTRFGILQAIALTVFGKTLIRGISQSIDAAGRAETAFNRLSVQLDLLGQGSRRNIESVVAFSREVASTTRFAARETQEAVAIALRRTGDVETALKQVAVAQDIAAATGRGLRRTTLLLNIAQAGNTRILKQITNLTNEQIRAAVRQGTLLDVLAGKFGGAASREAGTLAGKVAILRNEQELLSKSLGDIGLPIRKFGVDLITIGTRGLRFFVDEAKVAGGALLELGQRFTFIGQVSSIAGEGIRRLGEIALESSPLLRNLFTGVGESARAAVREITGAAGDIDRELEIRFLRAGKTRTEIRELTREISRVQQDLLQADRSGIQTLRRQQLERISNFRFAQRELRDIVKGNIEEDRRQDRARRRRIAEQRGAIAPTATALPSQIRESATLLNLLQRNGLRFGQAVNQIKNDLNILATSEIQLGRLTKQEANSLIERVNTLLDTSTSIEQAAARLRTFDTFIGRAAPVLKEIIETKIRPTFENVQVVLSLSQEQIRAAAQAGVAGAVTLAIQRLQRATIEGSRLAAAQADFGGE